jgi:hypothetical protein
MIVIERDGKFWAKTAAGEAGPFPTNAAAWSWIDRHSDEGREAFDRHARIRDAFAVR